MSFSPGENVGAYRIVEQLGSGGMATVYKAYHAALDRYVAIKVIHPAFRGDANFASRFRREARVVAKLDHPNIVPVYDFSQHQGSSYLVMRFVEGETLKARLRRGPITLPEILGVVRPVGNALDYAHSQGVLHRDIKPSNVLLRQDGQVFLTDFGLARIVEAGESSLTRDALVGTPQYISPEQAMGKGELDARTDIYSFGILLYELFTGRVPFQADTPYAVIHDHIYAPLPLPSSINPNLPPALEQVLLKALAKKPDDRYSTASQLVAAVEQAVARTVGVPPAEAAVKPTPPPKPGAAPGDARTVAVEPAQAPTKRPGTAPGPAADAKPTPGVGRRRRRLLLLGALAVLIVVAVAVGLLVAGGGAREAELQAEETPVAEPPSVEEQPSAEQPAIERPSLKEAPPDQDIGALIERGVELAAHGEIEAALDAFETAIQLDPHAMPAYVEAARALFQREEPGPAIDFLRRAVAANPEDIDVRLFLAQALVAQDRWDEAIPQLEWLLEREPEMVEAHAYLSVHLATNVGDLDGAHHHAAEALRIDPDSAVAHFAMGVFYWKAGDFRHARIELDRAQHSPGISPFLRERIQLILEKMEQDEPKP
jgi:Flp pilus assembly protein TadD